MVWGVGEWHTTEDILKEGVKDRDVVSGDVMGELVLMW